MASLRSIIEAVLEDETLSAIYYAAWYHMVTAQQIIRNIGSCPCADPSERAAWGTQMDDATERMHYAEGMVAATVYLPGSPFRGLGEGAPVRALWRIIDEEDLAKRLCQ